MNGTPRPLSRLWPHPLTSAVLFVAWLWLNDSVAAGQLVLAALLAFAIPLFTWRYWPQAVRVRRPLALLGYLLLVLWDVIVANLQVTLLILGPASRWRPAWVRIPLRLRDEFVTTVLASTVTLTPGTLSVEIEEAPDGGQVLLVHCLRCTDPGHLIQQVQRRYEDRLLEIFA